ncbi:MAG: preprotein translocase subunit SecG [bacterium]|nr:preprotein translocase subunit SecG [bacterium]
MSQVAAAATAQPHVQVTSLPVPQGAAAPVTLTAPQVQMPQTFFQMHASWLTHSIAGVFVVAAVALIVLLALQTTKQEGLSGTIGGRVESTYRGRLGAEEQLQRITGVAAVIFVVCAFFLSLTGI